MRTAFAIIFISFVGVSAQGQVPFGFFRQSLPPPPIACPANYVAVPPLAGYTSAAFCVAKYEAKNVSGVAKSQAGNAPWISISRSDAINACTANGTGYQLISNAQWQTIARNIEAQPYNWSTGVVQVNFINHGNSASAGLLAASVDTDPCNGTGLDSTSCSTTKFHQKRRTHKLSTGEVIWDLAGNAEEWVREDASEVLSSAVYMAFASGSYKTTYGPALSYASTAAESSPYGGLGVGSSMALGSGVARGGFASDTSVTAGIFRTAAVPSSATGSSRSFRCVYAP